MPRDLCDNYRELK